MLYDKKTLILEEVTSTFLSNENRKMPNQEEQEGLGFGGHKKERKRKKEKSGLVERVSLLSQRKSLEELLQASARVAEEKGANCEGRRSKRC